MKAYVFTDRALAKHAGRFVWLAIDGEKAVNAEFRRRYKIPGYPTYHVLDAVSGRVLMRWVGSASVGQLDRMFTDQSASYARRLRKQSQPTMADALLAHADSLYGVDEHAPAAAAYGRALAVAPPAWPRYARAVDSRLFSLTQADSAAQCVALAASAWPKLRGTVSAANVAASGLACALALPADAPRRAERVAEFERACREVLADKTLALTGDDRSGLYISLLDARQAAHDSVGQRQVAESWSAFLDGEAARARTPEARAVFDSHRLSAYIELGHAERAIPMLEASARDFPDDYNPPARLANTYRTLGRWDEAIAASDRAMALAYGPRKILFFQNRADIFKGRGDMESARRTLRDAIAYAGALPEGQRSDATIAGLEKRLDGLK
ncbi:MAG: tetratricopeptide repeat protein [Candidatus Eisenbacteria bacterium]